MLLFFHKGLVEQYPEHICTRFTRLDQFVFISCVTGSGDALSYYQSLRLACRIGSSLVCASDWPLDNDERIYTMWFDLNRIANLRRFPSLTMTAEAILDGTATVVTQQAVINVDLNYRHLITKTGGGVPNVEHWTSV